MEVRDFLKSLSPELINEGNKQQFIEADEEHTEFLTAFKKDCCYLCGMKLSYFNESEKCFHWFLLPDGIRKKHFKEYLTEDFGFFQLESYLRWVANTDENIKNINDLRNKNPDGKLVETTIKYKNIEWSLNFGQTDLLGHTGSSNGDFPHFHMQIFKDERPFISFNNYHIPFSDYDKFMLKAIENEDLVEHLNLHGEGISVIEKESELEWIDDKMVPCENEDDATFHTRSFFEMPEGETITGDRILELKEEARKKGIPLRKYMKEMIPNIRIQSEVNPGKGVIEKKTRN